jgi:RNA polymerase sigma factor (sigma-70 family)
MPTLTRQLVDRALAGDPGAQRLLVTELTPTIQWSVGKMLRRWRTGLAAARDLRQEVEDMVQEVFVELFEKDGLTLRRWDPDRLPLKGFVGYVARIRTAEVLRSRRSPWREQPSAPDDLPGGTVRRTPEDDTGSIDLLRKIHLCLTAGFSTDDAHLFDLFFLRQLPPQHVADTVDRTLAAVYKWRSRLYEKARQCRDQVSKLSSRLQRT